MKKLFTLAAAALILASCSQPEKVVDAPHEFHPEWSKNANMYEVNIRQYTPEGTFAAFQTHSAPPARDGRGHPLADAHSAYRGEEPQRSAWVLLLHPRLPRD